ncbi:GGDEF domain-containing protein [Microvirga terricola]|uniref:diguanylate cyclase n=1 Tax=Microvirga terricola TaxID=2719797 RepID=A0ABX0VBX6_9HYPH|nr:GGDEF domain-containing protein [Microvirga terricola]NIX76654.1 diguanylate cyclase [Microvirga terricola]
MHPPATSSPRSSAFWLNAFVVVVCLAIISLEGWRDWNERNAEVVRVEGNMANLAQSLAQHADDTFELADAVIVDIVDRIETTGATPATADRLHTFLSERIKTLPRLKALAIFGEDGRFICSSLGHLPQHMQGENQPFFKRHEKPANNDWFFSSLIRDPFDDKWVLSISRRIDKADGSFGGVAVVFIDPRYFSNYYSHFDVGSEGSIALFGSDGTLLSRYPHAEQAIGRSGASDPLFTQHLPRASAGYYAYTSNVDGMPRLSGYRLSDKFPVVTLAAVGRSQALARWDGDFFVRAIAVTLLVAAIGILGWGLASQLRQRERMEAELAVLAATDSLTGLANRRIFDRELAVECGRATRDGTSLSLLLIDVDRFKSFNDFYGHQAGDECLRSLAQVLSRTVRRPGDLVARYGGEEIAVLLPGTDADGAMALAEIIRARVEALAMRHEANAPLPVLTISIGSATLVPSLDVPLVAPETLVAMADRALYRAKLGGRNRIAASEAA